MHLVGLVKQRNCIVIFTFGIPRSGSGSTFKNNCSEGKGNLAAGDCPQGLPFEEFTETLQYGGWKIVSALGELSRSEGRVFFYFQFAE
jgi:hypothetical protein